MKPHPFTNNQTVFFKLTAAIILLFSLTACSSLPTSKPEAPSVKLAGIKPLSLGLKKSRLEFKLDVSNPNSFALPVQQLEFIAKLAGEEIAQGVSADRVTIPAEGNAMYRIAVDAKISRIFNQVKDLFKGDDVNLDYGLRGNIKIANWPVKIPFDVSGVLEQP